MANELLTIRLNSVNEILTLQEQKVVEKVRVGFEFKYCKKINVCGARAVSCCRRSKPHTLSLLVVWIMANQHDCVDLDRKRKLPRSVSSF